MQHVLAINPNDNFIKLCNSLRCPLCGSQLDGNIGTDLATLYCVSNNEEYKCNVSPLYNDPYYERIKYWYPQYEYEIFFHRADNEQHVTIIDRLNSDFIKLYKDSSRTRMLEITGPKILFFRKRMEEDVFLKKLKTYQTFS